MARMIDADRLADGLKLHRQPTDQKHEADRQWAVGYNAGLDRALHSIAYAPTLTPPNEPLTIEQLREMDGEPVWVTSARERGNIPSRWVLFAGVSKSKRNSDVFVFATTGGIAQGYEAVNYGKTWNAYRRPPEGEEK